MSTQIDDHSQSCGYHSGFACDCGTEERTAAVNDAFDANVASVTGTAKGLLGKPNGPNGAGSFLTQAAAIVEGSRQKTHGDKERSFAAAAVLWEAWLSARKAGRDSPIRPQDVAQCMSMLKSIRSEHGNPGEPDHYVDGCGYYALFGELSMADVLGQTRHDEPVFNPCRRCLGETECRTGGECCYPPRSEPRRKRLGEINDAVIKEPGDFDAL